MNEYIDEFENIFNPLTDMAEPISESMRVAMLLFSFADKTSSPYDHILSSLQSHTETPSWEIVTARVVQDYEENISSHNAERRIPTKDLPLNAGTEVTSSQ